MTIKAIIFDLDDTLLVEEASAEAAFVEACKLAHKKYGINPKNLNQTIRSKARELWYKSPARDWCVSIGVSSWEGLWASFEGDGPDLKIMQDWAPDYQKQAWTNALAEFDVKDESLAQDLSKTFQNHRRDLHIVYSDVEPVLKELQQSYKLALITNGAPKLQRHKLNGSKLGGYFDSVIISGEFGIRKPEPEIFEAVLNQLNTEPETVVMIGNSLKSDIAGAKKIGIKAVWLNRDNKKDDDSVEPDYEINNLNELQHLLNDLEHVKV